MIKKETPFLLFSIAVMIGLTLPVLIQDGMFMDAMLYTSVSHNLSQGIGTFWFPQFSANNVAGLASFHEQPPLVFGIQSIFFKIFGDSMYVERLYTFLTMCISAWIISRIWKEIFRNNHGYQKSSWLPVILWITIPVCFWSYSHNMHENTMGIFTLCAVYTGIKSFRSETNSLLLLLLSGIFIFLATFSKGIPGFFPVVLPFLYWLCIGHIKMSRMIFLSVIITITPVLIYSFLLLFPESNESLSTYFFKRVLHRINDQPTVDSHFYILGRLFMEILPQLLFMAIILFVARWKKMSGLTSTSIRWSLFFILTGLSASVPLMLTLVQKGFYFVPALPFFAIGIAIICVPYVRQFTEIFLGDSRRYKIALLFSGFILIGSLLFSFSKIGKTSRNEDMLHDVYAVGKAIEGEKKLAITSDMWNEWDLQCYFMRYFNISLSLNEEKYMLLNKSLTDNVGERYKKTDLPLIQYELYRKEQSFD